MNRVPETDTSETKAPKINTVAPSIAVESARPANSARWTSEQILQAKPSFHNSTIFRTPWYLRSGHIQTILGPYAIRRQHVHGTVRSKVPIAGEGQTFLYESKPEENRDSELGILMLHGLGGHHDSPYLTRIASLLVAAGFRAIRVDLPGCGPSARLSDRAAHAGCSDDLFQILRWGHENLGIKRWRIAGFSLGGNVTLKLLCELAEKKLDPCQVEIERAVVVAPPIDLAYCCALIEQGFNRVYNRFFLRTLKKYARMRATQWPRWKELVDRAPSRIRSIREFDDVFTSAIGGFQDANDYYSTCSTAERMHGITIPTSILVDTHDPIVPASLFDRFRIPSGSTLTKTSYGGHLGYFQRNEQGKIACWMDPWVVNELLN